MSSEKTTCLRGATTGGSAADLTQAIDRFSGVLMGDARQEAEHAHVMAAGELEAFEVWATDQGYPLERLDTFGDESFKDLRTEGARWAWQAALRWAATNPAPVVGEPSDAQLMGLISAHEVYQYHPGALLEFARAVLSLRSQPVQAESAPQCTNSDTWNCKYCRKTATCESLNAPKPSFSGYVEAAKPVQVDPLRTALERIKYKAVSLADAQVIALEALAGAVQQAEPAQPQPQQEGGVA